MKWRLLAAACALLALGLLLYPLLGELVSEKYHSDVEAVYTAAIADTVNAELAEQRLAAEGSEVQEVTSSWTQHYLMGLGIDLGVLAAAGGVCFLVRRQRRG